MKGLFTRRKPDYSDWEELGVISPLLKQLNAAEKDEWTDAIAQGIADSAADTKEYSGVFLSKLYKFTLQAVNPLFGEPAKPLTDVTLVREKDRIRPILLSTGTIDGDASLRNGFGFSEKTLPEIKLEPGKRGFQAENDVSWQTNGQKFTSHYVVKTAKVAADIVPQDKSPRYGQIWSDKKLVGTVITGTNLKGLASGVMDEYLAYYQDLGFTFGEPERISDLKKFVEQKTVSGEMDYLIKEAHSDGDEKNLFRMDKSAQYRTGQVKRPDGRMEIVYLIYPSGDETQSTLLANEEFGKWVRDRESSGKGQLVYFNTSCWSKTKAIYEIEAAASKNLLDIASTTTVNTFSSDSKNAENLLFTAFREGKSYEEMRASLSENEEYKKHAGNGFIFPDEDAYTDNITNVIKYPLKIDLQIRDGKGNPYSLENVH